VSTSTGDERIAALKRQLAALLVDNARLRARVEELERKLAENSSNSSKPPSSDSPADRTRSRGGVRISPPPRGGSTSRICSPLEVKTLARSGFGQCERNPSTIGV
jgi:transposase